MAMKRANGTGSVYKMKHKPLRKPYRAVITAGWTAEGKPIKRSLGTFAKQADAYQALAQFASNPDAFAERKMTTFGQVFDVFASTNFNKFQKSVKIKSLPT